MEIRKEIPLGAINGINKTFTLANEIGMIDDVFMDGVIYTSFSFSGNQLTLSDAPTLSIFVDYSTTSTTPSTDSETTLGDILGSIWSLLWQKSTSTTFSRDYLVGKVNQTMRKVLKGRVKSILWPNSYRVGDIWFMENRHSVRFKSGSAVVSNYTIGDTSIECATTGLLVSGYVEIDGDIISYTGITTDVSIDGVSLATSDHLVWEKIIQLYELPIDLDKIKSVSVKGEKDQDVPMDDTETKYRYYRVIPYDGKQLLKLSGIDSDSLVSVEYQIKYTNMVDDTDMCVLPEDYGVSVISYMVAGEEGVLKWLPNGQAILGAAYASLQDMYQDLSTKKQIVKQSIKPISYKHNVIK